MIFLFFVFVVLEIFSSVNRENALCVCVVVCVCVCVRVVYRACGLLFTSEVEGGHGIDQSVSLSPEPVVATSGERSQIILTKANVRVA